MARGLQAWSKSRKGERAGRAVGFPRFKSARAPRSVRFITGTIRIETDRRHVTLPRLGAIRTHESTPKLARRLEAGPARILSATVRQDSAGRWYCSLQTLIEAKAQPAHTRRSAHPVVGVDVEVKADSLLVIAAPDGTEVDRVPAPKPLSVAQSRLRALQRRAARQHGTYDPATRARRAPSKRWRKTQARIGRTHAHARRKPNLTLADRVFDCDDCGIRIDRELGAAINFARLGVPTPLGEQSPAGSGPVAGRGAMRETEPAPAGQSAGHEASTPHHHPVDQTGTASPQGEAA